MARRCAFRRRSCPGPAKHSTRRSRCFGRCRRSTRSPTDPEALRAPDGAMVSSTAGPRTGILPDRPQLLFRPAGPDQRRPDAVWREAAEGPGDWRTNTSVQFRNGCWRACWRPNANCTSSESRSRRATTRWPRPSTKLRRSMRMRTWRPIISN